MKRDFVSIITSEDMTIGHIPGSDNVLFIKTGQGGSIYGYNNRYLELCNEINERYGFSVFVSATIIDTRESFLRDIRIVEEALGRGDFEIYYLGVSKGGLVGIWYGCDEPRIVRMVSVNAPLMINYHGKTLPGIKRLGRDRLTMIYGSLDPSYKYIPFAEKHAKIQLLEGEGHNINNLNAAVSELI
jgi:hypothetical protein